MATFGLVLDCVDPVKLADFWAEALGYRKVAAEGNYVVLLGAQAGHPKLLLQRVPEVKQTKNRMHLDIGVSAIEAEAARLEAIGARRSAAAPMTEHGTSWILMADPEGNEFCVCDGGAPD